MKFRLVKLKMKTGSVLFGTRRVGTRSGGRDGLDHQNLMSFGQCTLFMKKYVAVCQVRRDPRGEAFPLHWLREDKKVISLEQRIFK